MYATYESLEFTVRADSKASRNRGTHVTFVAVVGWLVLHTILVTDLLPRGNQLVSQNLDMLDGLQQAVSEKERQKSGK